jgi:TPR repeat protein
LALFKGEGIAQDYKEAVKWVRLAAEQGDAKAQLRLGVAYYEGKGVPQDYAEAVKWFRLAAEQGDADAQFCLGLALFKGEGIAQDYKEAVKWYRLAAEQGNALAQGNLGAAYADGQGAPQDYKEAVKWCRLAAEQGNAPAQFTLGVRCFKGEGVPQDYKEAVKWYRLAAKQGEAFAQYHLGVCYANGQGVPQDYAQAYAWINMAATQGDKAATELRTRLVENMTPSQIEEGQRLSREYAANRFNPAAPIPAKTNSSRSERVLTLSSLSLDGFTFSMLGLTPSPDTVYPYAKGGSCYLLKVLQSTKDGVLICGENPPGLYDQAPDRNLFIKTKRQYADNDLLESGYFLYSGLIEYKTVLGTTAKVYSFEETDKP